MGIDVGGLDACILVGFPGSVMATWQRSGRVGRAERESITAMVALPDAPGPVPSGASERAGGAALRASDRRPRTTNRSAKPISSVLLPSWPSTAEDDAPYGSSAHAVQLVGSCCENASSPSRRTAMSSMLAVADPSAEVSLRGSSDTATILDSRSGKVIGTVRRCAGETRMSSGCGLPPRRQTVSGPIGARPRGGQGARRAGKA